MDRAAVWSRFGAPSNQDGSVNEPRGQEECGVIWNERWRYPDPEGGGWDRVVLWYRYDLLGVFRVGADGSFAREPDSPG
jgi:hypothetical protein